MALSYTVHETLTSTVSLIGHVAAVVVRVADVRVRYTSRVVTLELTGRACRRRCYVHAITQLLRQLSLLSLRDR